MHHDAEKNFSSHNDDLAKAMIRIQGLGQWLMQRPAKPEKMPDSETSLYEQTGRNASGVIEFSTDWNIRRHVASAGDDASSTLQ